MSWRAVPWRVQAGRAAFVLLAALVVGWAADLGLSLRQWVWNYTQPVRFSDIRRGFRYGWRANQEGYLDLYAAALKEGERQTSELDYAPLRMLVMKRWVRQTLAKYPDVGPNDWKPEYAFTAPALRFNTVMEAVGALGVFLLVRLWWVRSRYAAPADGLMPGAEAAPRAPPEPPTSRWGRLLDGLRRLADYYRQVMRPFRGWIAGLGGALLLWFNPAMLWSAHGWPTWDIWIIPFFVWAVFFACLDLWFWAGVTIGLGALFKGQQLIIAPLFILWPIFMGRPLAALRFVLGAGLSVALAVSAWMITVPVTQFELSRVGRNWVAKAVRDPDAPLIHWPAVHWVITVVLATLIAGWRRLAPRLPWYWFAAPAAVAFAAVALYTHAWPIAGHWAWGTLFALALVTVGWLMPLRGQPYVLAAALASALWLCIPMFKASTAWFTVGWAYGTHHWEWMIMGMTSNVPGLLAKRFGYANLTALKETVFTLEPGALGLWPAEAWPVTMKTLLATIFAVTLVLCAIGAARHYRHRDPRFLVAVTAPWLLMFTILGQIHERYLLFAAGIGACLIAVNWGFVLLHLLLTVITWAMTMHVMLLSSRGWWGRQGTAEVEGAISREWAAKLYRWIDASHPDVGWAVALAACVFLYTALMKPRRREPGG